MSDNYVLDILLSEDDYMGTGFTKKQYHALQELVDGFCRQLQQRSPAPPSPPPSAPLAASPPAHKPFIQAPPELPPQPISAPVPAPAPARSYPPSPSVETIEEVELKQVYKIPLRNVKQMRKMKHRASKTCVVESLENWIAWPPRFGGIYMRFSRDEEPDAWYTTMLNATDALPYRT